jgi:tetratricopeptide (TPR) repeat protein
MSDHLARAQMLLAQNRYELAERELGLALAETPQEPALHATLALCLIEQNKLPGALEAAREAIHLGPDEPYSHYCLAAVHERDHKPRLAEEAIGEAIRLDPYDADHFGMLAAVLAQQSRWREALTAAEQGLSIDAEHTQSGNIRSLALTKLGRRDEARAAAAEGLRRNPENALGHANLGWTRLHEGRHKEALEHFREALRIDPTSDWARAGMVESLKARYFVYRWLLRYFLWMSSLSGRAKWAVIIGLYVLYRAAGSIEEQRPDLAVFTRPLTVGYLIFFLTTWLGSTLFNVMLRLNRYGRYALSADQVCGSNRVLALLAGCLLFVGLWLYTGLFIFVFPAGYLIAMTFPVSSVYNEPRPRSRRLLRVYMWGLAILGASAIGALFFRVQLGLDLIMVFAIAWAGFSWFANWVAIRS